MKVYSVHVRVDAATSDRDALFVREGFSWGALVFTVFWALYHRLWLASSLMAVAFVALALIGAWLEPDSSLASALGLALNLLIGFEGNDWLRVKLARRGYVELGPVVARGGDEAEQRFFADA